MKTTTPIDPWQRAQTSPEERRAAGLLRDLDRTEPLAMPAWARIRANVATARPRRSAGRRWMRLGLAVAAAALIPMSVAMAGPTWRWLRAIAAARIERLPIAAPRPAVAAAVPPPAVPVPVLAPAPSPAPPPRAGQHGGAADGLGVGLFGESALLQEAVRALSGDPAAALAALARYRSRYPRGALASQARLLEVEAQMAGGHDAAALALLDDLHAQRFAGSPRAQELGVLRAELLAGAGRCTEAIVAGGEVIGQASGSPLPPALEERARYTLGACRVRVGDSAGAQREFEAYLARFPDGRFSAEARAEVER